MNIILKEKIEFNPQKDLMGKITERNRTGHRYQGGFKGL
jgi:hypothetical protein